MGCGGVGTFEEFEYINGMLRKHNEIRTKHNVESLKINNQLNKLAKNYAKNVINNLEYKEPLLYKEHSLGENIFISKTGLSSEEICEAWYNEHQNYDYNKNKFQKGTGHFTQLVWKETKEVGFGKIEFGDLLCMVALYYPAGNEFGEFTKNVFQFNYDNINNITNNNNNDNKNNNSNNKNNNINNNNINDKKDNNK